MVVSCLGHEPPPGGVSGPVGGQDYILEMEFRRRNGFYRTAPDSRVSESGTVHCGAERGGAGGQLATVEDLGCGGEVKRFRAVILLLAGGVLAAQIPDPGAELNRL